MYFKSLMHPFLNLNVGFREKTITCFSELISETKVKLSKETQTQGYDSFFLFQFIQFN